METIVTDICVTVAGINFLWAIVFMVTNGKKYDSEMYIQELKSETEETEETKGGEG